MLFSVLRLVVLLGVTCLLHQREVLGAAPAKRIEVRFGVLVLNPPQGMRYESSKQEFPRAMSSFSRMKLTEKLKIVDPPLVVSLNGNFSPNNVLHTLCHHLLPKRINALLFVTFDDDPNENNAVGYLFQLLSFLQLPAITWRPQNTAQVNSDLLVLQMSSTIAQQIDAIFRRYNYGQISVVVAHSPGDDVFLSAIRQERNETFKPKILSVVKIDPANVTDVRAQLKTFNTTSTSTRIFVFYARREAANIILRVATEFNLTGAEYLWICMQKVIGDEREKKYPSNMQDFPSGMLGIDMEMTDASSAKTLGNGMRIYGHALDLMLKESNYSADQFSPNVSCSANRAWDLGRDFFKAMKRVTVPADGSARKKIEFNLDGTVKFAEFSITSLVREKGKQSPAWVTVGSWNTENGLQLRDIVWPGGSAIPPRGQPDKFHLKVVTLEEDPFIIIKPPDDSGQCEARAQTCRSRPANWTKNSPDVWEPLCCSGLCIELLVRLGAEIGFTYDIYRVEDGNFGLMENGTWNGLIADLIGKKADLALTSLKVTKERQKAIAFSSVYLETGISIVVSKREGVISPTAFLEPFDYTTWIILMIVCVQTVSIVMFMLEWLSPSGFNMGSSLKAKQRFSFLRVYWLVFATFFGSNIQVNLPRSFSAKALTAVWGCCSLVFVTVYTANLATFMITKDEHYNITGIDDVRLRDPTAHKPEFRFGTIKFGSTAETLMQAYPIVYRYMKGFVQKDVAEGIQSVKNGSLHAFLYDATVLKYRVGSDPECKIATTGSWFATTGYGIAFPKDFNKLALFDEFLLNYQRNGFLEQLQGFWLTGACNQKSQEKKSHPLEVKHFSSAFYFLGAGLVFGVICLIIEWIYFHCLRVGLCQWVYTCKMCRFLSTNLSRSISAAALKHQPVDHRRVDLDLVLISDLNKNAEQLQAARAQVERLEKIRERLRQRKPSAIEMSWGAPAKPEKADNGGFEAVEPWDPSASPTELNVVEFETVL